MFLNNNVLYSILQSGSWLDDRAIRLVGPGFRLGSFCIVALNLRILQYLTLMHQCHTHAKHKRTAGMLF